jgi:hypothetical protein
MRIRFRYHRPWRLPLDLIRIIAESTKPEILVFLLFLLLSLLPRYVRRVRGGALTDQRSSFWH